MDKIPVLGLDIVERQILRQTDPKISTSYCQVRRLNESGTRFVDDQILRKHDMIVNTIIMDGDTILSAGWDSKLVFWVKCHFVTASFSFYMKHLAEITRKQRI